MVQKGSHEPIISPELFNQAQEVHEKHRTKSYGTLKIKVFTGKVFVATVAKNIVLI